MTPPTTAPGPHQPQPPRQASALLEVAIAAAPMLAAATRAVKSFRIVSTSIHDGFCRPTQDQGTLHIDWLNDYSLNVDIFRQNCGKGRMRRAGIGSLN